MVLITRVLTAALLLVSLAIPPALAREGTTVLITGANRGIGLALAQAFTGAGYQVIGTARTPDTAMELKASGARVLPLDVTDAASVDAMAAALEDTPIDIMINNAGIKGQDSRDFAALQVDDIHRVLDVNTLGPLRVMQALFPNVLAGERKVFANISSMMGSMEMNTWGCCLGYRASKAALNSATKTLAQDFGKLGLSFVVLHPGYVQTDMNDGQGRITPEQSAAGLLKVISALGPEDNGRFYDWQGKTLPW
ncbi:MAG: SDR family oxidoreductase [Halieaceae bacterium]|jgi:NAD(P)-dependent dehydrogenase (short-subunit alcohol dehydrogenase family)|nr:SDR family oxidoreductase [Halieaceae bacterium]